MASKSAWPRPDEAPAMDDLTKCVHCGLCVNACPTYAITGLETESPRGRIFLARGVSEGTIPLTATVQSHWELCLQCRACEAVCPSGVPYGRIMEHTRAQLDAAAPANRGQRRIRKLLLRNVVGRKRVLATVMAPARVYARTPLLRPLLRRSGFLRLLGPLGRAEAQIPRRPSRFTPTESITQPSEPTSAAAMFTGCVMTELFGDVHRATVNVLARRGVGVVVPNDQGCCGALHAHDGDLAHARKLARRVIDDFESTGEMPVVVNSAGCGAAMKEYGELLEGDGAYASRALAFSARVQDFSELVATLPSPAGASFAHTVTYQDACHLVHAQRIREQPRTLLSQLTGCDLRETPGADMCCGAAGIYSLVQPAMSAQLRAKKADQFVALEPDVIVTANPGCQMQYEQAVRERGLRARVMHIAEVLDEAESG